MKRRTGRALALAVALVIFCAVRPSAAQERSGATEVETAGAPAQQVAADTPDDHGRDRGRLEIGWFGHPEINGPGRSLCILMPSAACRVTIHLDFGVGGGRTYGNSAEADASSEGALVQLFADLGVLFAASRSPAFHLGPVVGFESRLIASGAHYQLSTALKARLWLHEWITLDGALGVGWSFDEQSGSTGGGGVGELAFTVHGHLGVYVQVHVIDTGDDRETRVFGGVRGSLAGWGAIFYALLNR